MGEADTGTITERRRVRLFRTAHAFSTGSIILTANTDEFRRIRLKVANWLA